METVFPDLDHVLTIFFSKLWFLFGARSRNVFKALPLFSGGPEPLFNLA